MPGCDVFPWGFCMAATEKKAVALQCLAGCHFRKRSLERKPCSWSVQGSFRPSPCCVPCVPSRENRRMLDRHMTAHGHEGFPGSMQNLAGKRMLSATSNTMSICHVSCLQELGFMFAGIAPTQDSNLGQTSSLDRN